MHGPVDKNQDFLIDIDIYLLHIAVIIRFQKNKFSQTFDKVLKKS